MSEDKTITVTSNPNIAIVKYWGKEDKSKNVCSNASISFQLNNLQTCTSISFSEKEDEFIFNDEKTELNGKIEYIVQLFRRIVKDDRPIRITSSNNFPHSCGIASSASGFSALVLALNSFYNTNFSEHDLSVLARECSGSASRSIPRDIVLCDKYSSSTIDSWKEVKIFLVNIDGSPKKVGSTEGMCRTAETSFFYKDRQARIDDKVQLCLEYIKTRDHKSLFKLIMRESNEIHAVMFESYPPIRYINDAGYKIMEKVHEYNADDTKLAYTFDAGTNPFIFVMEQEVENFLKSFKMYDLIKCN